EQVGGERLVPIGIGQRQGPAARRGGPTDVVDQDVEAAETLHDRRDDLLDSGARTDVGGDDPLGRTARGQGAGRGEHRDTAAPEALHNGGANTPGAPCHQNASAVELGGFACVRCMLHTSLLRILKFLEAVESASALFVLMYLAKKVRDHAWPLSVAPPWHSLPPG